jgi:anaerobic selenocysteine-containing dehydrogenase
MRRGRPQRGKLVAVHPRLSLTGIKADEWIPIRPGTYGALALGMANVMINSELYDADFVRDFTFGFEDFEDENGEQHRGFKSLVLEEYDLEKVSDITGIATEVIARLAGEFATNRPAVAIMPNEIGELNSGNSLYTAMAIHALNALVGSIDASGGVLVQRFPKLTPWPDYTPDAAAQAGLSQARIDGAGSRLPLAISSYQAGIGAILQGEPYPVEALFLLNANPVYEIPNGGRTAQALLNVPFVVSFASTMDESAVHADLILPASTFLEVWGDDFLEGTGFAGVSLRQPVVKARGETRNPADVFLSLADMLGGPLKEALPWSLYWSLVQDRLDALELDWEKFTTNGNWSEMIYFNAAPGSKAWGNIVGRDRLNSPQDGRFDLFSRELFSLLDAPEDIACLPHFQIPDTLSSAGNQEAGYPFLLVSQALITQSPMWHGIVPTLQESYGLQPYVRWGSWVEMNPKAAEGMGLEDNDWVWVESSQGRVKAILRLYEGIWPNAVFIPAGQGHHTGVSWGRGMPAGTEVGANVSQLMPVTTEGLNGQAVYNPARVRIYKA